MRILIQVEILVAFILSSSVSLTLMKFTIRQLFLLFQNAVIIISELVGNHDRNICSYDQILFNDGVHDTVINITFETFVVLDKMLVHLKFLEKEFPSDQIFRKEHFSTTFDVSRFFKGVQGNFIIKIFAESFLKSLTFAVPTFPLQKVERFECDSKFLSD